MKNKFIGYYRLCDFITMSGTVSSLIGIFLCFNNNINIAVICLLFSGICDAFDGIFARKRDNTNSEIEYGVQLDSLSDVICFGVLPSIITYKISNSILSIVTITFYLLCGLIRLAYFNMLHTTKKAKKGIYIGLPITAITIFYPLVYLIFKLLISNALEYVMPILLIVMGILFISNIEIKKIDWTKYIKI